MIEDNMTAHQFLQTENWALSECSNLQESKKLIYYLKNRSLPASLSRSLSLFEIVKVC